MPPAPSPLQTLFLWRLLADPEGGFVADLKPTLTAPARKQLLAWGLIEIEKRKRTLKSRPADYALLSEQGWSWAEAHLDAPLPTRGTAALVVLEKLLSRLKPQVAAGRIALSELLRAPQVEPPTEVASASLPPTAASPPGELTRRVVEVCRHLTGDGVYGGRVRLADLRSQLADVPRFELDQVLLALEESQTAVLYPFDDPREQQPGDAAAALGNSAGRPRYLLRLKPPH